MTRYILAFITAALLAGCHATLIPKEKLRAPAAPMAVAVKEPWTHYPESGASSHLGFRLLPGVCNAVFEDDLGTYFQCPAGSLTTFSKKTGETIAVRDGGLWVPHVAGAHHPKLFGYEGTIRSPGQPATSPAAASATGQEAAGALAVQNIASGNIPTGTRPLAAGVGGALGGAVVAMMIASMDPTRIYFLFDSIPVEPQFENVEVSR